MKKYIPHAGDYYESRERQRPDRLLNPPRLPLWQKTPGVKLKKHTRSRLIHTYRLKVRVLFVEPGDWPGGYLLGVRQVYPVQRDLDFYDTVAPLDDFLHGLHLYPQGFRLVKKA